MNSLNHEQASSLLGIVVDIYNGLLHEKPQMGWVKLGIFIEQLTEQSRKELQAKQAKISNKKVEEKKDE